VLLPLKLLSAVGKSTGANLARRRGEGAGTGRTGCLAVRAAQVPTGWCRCPQGAEHPQPGRRDGRGAGRRAVPGGLLPRPGLQQPRVRVTGLRWRVAASHGWVTLSQGLGGAKREQGPGCQSRVVGEARPWWEQGDGPWGLPEPFAGAPPPRHSCVVLSPASAGS